MKKFILSVAAVATLSTGAFAFTDNYNINLNMAEKYKNELSYCFDFLQKEPSSNKYFGYLFKREGKGLNKVSNDAYNEEIKKQLLNGGYGTFKGKNGRGQEIYRDVEDMLFASAIIASSLKHGRESVFVNDVNKWKSIGDRNGFVVIKMSVVMGENSVCGYNNIIIDKGVLDTYLITDEKRPKQWYFNGDLESFASGSFKLNVKSSIELYGQGVPIWTKDSYMGYSLSKGNSFLKKGK